jgi:hypothetical protein
VAHSTRFSLSGAVDLAFVFARRRPNPKLGGPHPPAFGECGDNENFLKLSSAKQSISGEHVGAGHFWQKRYYDRNIRSHSDFKETLRYIPRNPVKRELCEKPEDWTWSSFRHYALGEMGAVEIESEWTTRRREDKKTEALQAGER